jgi:hypothetical protein
MPALRLRPTASVLAFLSFCLTIQAQDLHLKRTVSVEGNAVSSSEIWVKGARERNVTTSPTGTTVTLHQCDLKRTVTINDQAQTYFVAGDAQDDAAMKAAALLNGGSAPAPTGGTVNQTITISDTGERKTMLGFAARRLKMTVAIEPSQGACSQVSQKYEIDGWYADVNKDQASCQDFLPPVRQTEGCNDRVVIHRSGTGKPGYPLSQTITLHNPDSSTMKIAIAAAVLPKQTLGADQFDVPANYRQVNSATELVAAGQAVQPAASYAPQQAMAGNNYQQPANSQFGNMAGAMGQGGMMAQAQQMGMGQMGGMGSQMQAAPGMGGVPNGTPIALPQALGPKAPGKIRVGVAPAQAQMGQGNDAQNDYGTPVRNSIIYLMNGPSVEIAALDSRLPMQVQAEAQQKQCDYILMSGVTIKHGGGGFGKFMKAGNMAASMTPIGMMAHSAGAVAATQAATMATQAATQMATQAAMQAAEQAAKGQLAGLNGQIKSKDDVTVEYQLFPTGQDKAVLANTLKGKAKSDGEDVLTPLIQQAANSVLTQVTKK